MAKRTGLVNHPLTRRAGRCAVAVMAMACSTSSGVVPVGQGTYMVSRSRKSFRGLSGPIKAAALKEANSYCAQEGRVMLVLRTTEQDMKPFKSDAAAEVFFKCLEPDDPELDDPAPFDEIRR